MNNNSIKILANWLEKYNWKVYLNQKNNTFPTFHQTNTNAKPDILVTKNNKKALIEVKKGDKHKQI